MIMMAIIISFIGWCIETIYCNAGETIFYDRGFLSLPFCGIYGITLVIIYLVFGTPFDGRLRAQVEELRISKIHKNILSFLLYFIVAVAVPTFVELIVAVFFDKIFNIILWTYEDDPCNFHGYICLGYSLTWGALITVAMATAWRLIYALVKKIPDVPLFILNLILCVFILIDYVFNMAYLIVKGSHYYVNMKKIFRLKI